MTHNRYPLLLAFVLVSAYALHAQGEPESEGVVRVASLVYADGKTSVCFSSHFLDIVRRESDINVDSGFTPIELGSEALFDFPFAVMTGEGAFTLSDEEIEHLGDYLDRGGFLLASAGCSNGPWDRSFRKVLERLGVAESLQPVGLEHPVFHTLYDIDRVDLRKQRTAEPMLGLERGGRLSLLYSPLGLNDTGRAGGGCCCCGGNEIRNATQINANLLVYALTE